MAAFLPPDSPYESSQPGLLDSDSDEFDEELLDDLLMNRRNKRPYDIYNTNNQNNRNKKELKSLEEFFLDQSWAEEKRLKERNPRNPFTYTKFRGFLNATKERNGVKVIRERIKSKKKRNNQIDRNRGIKHPYYSRSIYRNNSGKGTKRKKRTKKRKPIKINPKMKGVFTRKAKKKGMSVQKYAAYIIKKYKGKTKNKKQLKLLRQAVFAKTAKKWKKHFRKK